MKVMAKLAGQVYGAVLDAVFPPACVGCGAAGSLLCPSCLAAAPRLAPPLCPRCSEPTPRGAGPCPRCAEAPLQIDGIRSMFLYQAPIKEAVHRLKYGNVKGLGAVLGRLLAGYASESDLGADVVVPVPLHPRRLRERGYNQAGLMAVAIAEATGLPVDQRSLLRRRYEQTQARAATREERRRNVLDAFTCRRGALGGKSVLLVDDVCTTGFTLEACAVALREAGARAVYGLTLAREI